AGRGHLPRNEVARPLRETIGKKSAGEGRSDPPGPQAGPQAITARRAIADEGQARAHRRRRQIGPTARTTVRLTGDGISSFLRQSLIDPDFKTGIVGGLTI